MYELVFQPVEVIQAWNKSLGLSIIAGICLGGHFSFWVLSLDHTSLTHSLLFVTMSPPILAVLQWLGFFLSLVLPIPSIVAPTLWQSVGCVVCIVGAALALGEEIFLGVSSGQVTLLGDMYALVGALFMVFYLLIGAKVRQSVSIWLYMTPVVTVSAISCLILSLLFEDVSIAPFPTSHSVGGFLTGDYIVVCLGLGGIAGVFGHTLMNFLLKSMPPLVISSALLWEPVVGSLLGVAFGFQELPHLFTWIGAPVMLIGLFLVVYGSSLEEKEEKGGGRKKGGGKEGSDIDDEAQSLESDEDDGQDNLVLLDQASEGEQAMLDRLILEGMPSPDERELVHTAILRRPSIGTKRRRPSRKTLEFDLEVV